MKRLLTAIIICSMAAALFSCSDSKGSSATDKSSAATQGTENQTTEELEEPDYPTPEVDANAITYENTSDLYTAHCMDSKNYEDDESNCNLSVADFKGSKQLKIEVLDKGEDGNYKTPKIVFDMDELVGADNLSHVKSFSADLTQVAVGEFVGDDGIGRVVPGNLMGTFGSILGEDCDEWYEPTGSANGFGAEEWNFGWTYLHVEGKWLLKGFVDGTPDSTLVFMRWSIPNQADVYIDNLTFYDEDGNSIPIVYNPAQE